MIDDEILKSAPLNTANPVEFAAEEYLCAMKVLDEMGIPRENEVGGFSLVGRIRIATGTWKAPNDLKLSDGGAWRGSCVVERSEGIRTTKKGGSE